MLLLLTIDFIWVIAILLSWTSLSVCSMPWCMSTAWMLSRLLSTTSCSWVAESLIFPSASGLASRHCLAVVPNKASLANRPRWHTPKMFAFCSTPLVSDFLWSHRYGCDNWFLPRCVCPMAYLSTQFGKTRWLDSVWRAPPRMHWAPLLQQAVWWLFAWLHKRRCRIEPLLRRSPPASEQNPTEFTENHLWSNQNNHSSKTT